MMLASLWLTKFVTVVRVQAVVQALDAILCCVEHLRLHAKVNELLKCRTLSRANAKAQVGRQQSDRGVEVVLCVCADQRSAMECISSAKRRRQSK